MIIRFIYYFTKFVRFCFTFLWSLVCHQRYEDFNVIYLNRWKSIEAHTSLKRIIHVDFEFVKIDVLYNSVGPSMVGRWRHRTYVSFVQRYYLYTIITVRSGLFGPHLCSVVHLSHTEALKKVSFAHIIKCTDLHVFASRSCYWLWSEGWLSIAWKHYSIGSVICFSDQSTIVHFVNVANIFYLFVEANNYDEDETKCCFIGCRPINVFLCRNMYAINAVSAFHKTRSLWQSWE